MSAALMVYGATGYVGEHVARTAGRLGIKAIIAGRGADRLDRVGDETGLERRAFGLDDPAAIDRALKDVAVVLNCAGPFKYAAEPLVEGCLRSRAHYLDITSEIPVYEALQARDGQAKARGVMLLPGVGFDVVPTDCFPDCVAHGLIRPKQTFVTAPFGPSPPATRPPAHRRRFDSADRDAPSHRPPIAGRQEIRAPARGPCGGRGRWRRARGRRRPADPWRLRARRR